jgi:hypothetical protein
MQACGRYNVEIECMALSQATKGKVSVISIFMPENAHGLSPLFDNFSSEYPDVPAYTAVNRIHGDNSSEKNRVL